MSHYMYCMKRAVYKISQSEIINIFFYFSPSVFMPHPQGRKLSMVLYAAFWLIFQKYKALLCHIPCVIIRGPFINYHKLVVKINSLLLFVRFSILQPQDRILTWVRQATSVNFLRAYIGLVVSHSLCCHWRAVQKFFKFHIYIFLKSILIYLIIFNTSAPR